MANVRVVSITCLNDWLSLSSASVCNTGSQRSDVDDLDLWHRRLADYSHHAIVKRFVTSSLRGVTLDRKFFNVKNLKSYRCACDVCARAKMHQILFPHVRDRLEELSPGARMSADVLTMQNIPSREGNQYVFFIVDHATKMCWVYPLKTRESKYISDACTLRCLRYLH